MTSTKKISEFSGQEWLLKNDPIYKTGTAIRCAGALARRLVQFQDRRCGSARIDEETEEGLSLRDTLAAPNPEEIEKWRSAEVSPELEVVLDVLRQEGTAGLAKRLGCSQRRVQQKLASLLAGAGQSQMAFEWGLK